MDPHREVVKGFYLEKLKLKNLLNLAHINSELQNKELAY